MKAKIFIRKNELVLSARSAAVITSVVLLFAYGDLHGSNWTRLVSGSGNGTWEISPNWSGGVPNAVNAVANFNMLNITTDSTITLTAQTTVGFLNFGDTTPTNNWTVSGGNLILSVTMGLPVISVSNQITTLATPLSGATGFVKEGNGTLALSSNASNLSGPIQVTAGVVKGSIAGAFKTITGDITVAAGASLLFSSVFDANTYTNKLILSGVGTSSTTGALNLGGNEILTGGITLLGPTTITHDYNNGSIATAPITGVDQNLQLKTTQIGQPGLTVTSAIQTGVGGVSVTGANNGPNGYNAAVQLGGNNTFTGGLTINNGIVQLSHVGALNSTTGSENSVNFGPDTGSGALSLNGKSVVIANLTSHASPGSPVVQNGSPTAATLTVGNAQDLNGNFAGILQNGIYYSNLGNNTSSANSAPLTLAKSGNGTLTLSGSNTYTGGTFLYSGILALGHATNTLPNIGPVTISGGSLDLGGNSDTVGLVTMTGGAIRGTGTLTASAYNLQGGSISACLGGNATVTKSGSGLVTLSALNTYTGATQVNAGILTFANTFSKSGASVVTAAAGAAIGLGVGTANGGFSADQVASLFNSTASENSSGLGITLATSGSPETSAGIAIDTAAGNFDLSTALTGSRDLTKLGANALTISGGAANTFSGAIKVAAGTLKVTDGLSFKNVTGAITVASGATFIFGQNFTANNLNNAVTLSGAGDGTYGALNLGTNAVVAATITLAADATISHDYNNATISGSITGANTNLTLDSSISGQGPLTIEGNISLGSGTLTKIGENSVTLSGTNSYASLSVNAGRLYFQRNASMGGTGANILIASNAVVVRNGTALSTLLARVSTASAGAIAFGGPNSSASGAIDLTNHPFLSVGSSVDLSYSGALTPGGGNYRLGGGGGVLTVTSALSGSSGLIVHDPHGGTVILAGSHTYSGATTVTAGTLSLNGTLAGVVTVASGATLTLGLNAYGPSLTAPNVTINGKLNIINNGGALPLGASFKIFDVSKTITQNNALLNLPPLPVGQAWDYSGLLTTGIIKVVAFSTVGDPSWPQLLPAQVEAIYESGYPSAIITPGTYEFPDLTNSEASFTFGSNWTGDFIIDATGVTLVVGKQKTFYLNGCSNLTIKGATIRARYPSFTQGRLLNKGMNPDGTAYAIWRVADGYPNVFAGAAINAVNQATGIIDPATGDNYNSKLSDLGDRTWKIDFTRTTALPCSVNDWLVTRLNSADQQASAVRLNSATGCTIQSVTSQGGGFATFFETGGGGNRLIDCKIECSPVAPSGGTELPVVSCAADGFHSSGAYPGPSVENLTCTGAMLDDCIAIHGHYQKVLSISGNTIVCDGDGSFVVGEPVRISYPNGFIAQANCIATQVSDSSAGTYQITLDQALAAPVGSYASNPKYNGSGFRILNCKLGNTRARAVITKADDGLISGCWIEDACIAAINIGPEKYWNESDYSWNVTVTDNIISGCGIGINVVSDGSMGNKYLTIKNNSLSTIRSGYGFSLNGCDTITVSGNDFDAPTAKPAIFLKDSQCVAFDNNLVSYAAGAQASLSIGSSVSSVTGSANGILYSGRPYALSNSLSNLLMANPCNGAAGSAVQQYSNCNAAGRWTLEPAGHGYRRIVNAASGLVLGAGNKITSGSAIVLEDYGSSDSQLWKLTPEGTSNLVLVNKLSGLAASVTTSAVNETASQLSSTGNSGQLWTAGISDYTYSSWNRFYSAASVDPNADDDDDGLPNLLEYALKTNPLVANCAPGSAIESLSVTDVTGTYLTLQFDRRVTATDIAFHVEFSSDLSSWADTAVPVTSILNADGSTTELWRSPKTIDAETRGFLRVRVNFP